MFLLGSQPTANNTNDKKMMMMMLKHIQQQTTLIMKHIRCKEYSLHMYHYYAINVPVDLSQPVQMFVLTQLTCAAFTFANVPSPSNIYYFRVRPLTAKVVPVFRHSTTTEDANSRMLILLHCYYNLCLEMAPQDASDCENMAKFA